jgi:hypothetical protein
VVGVRIRHSVHLVEEPFDCNMFHVGRGFCLGDAEDRHRGPMGYAQGVVPHEDPSGPGHMAEWVVR